jgi:hypothetical protein
MAARRYPRWREEPVGDVEILHSGWAMLMAHSSATYFDTTVSFSGTMKTSGRLASAHGDRDVPDAALRYNRDALAITSRHEIQVCREADGIHDSADATII